LLNNNVKLYLLLKTSENKAVSFTDCWFTDNESGIYISNTTDVKGKAEFNLIRGKSYILNTKDSSNLLEIKIPNSGSSFITKTIVYNPPLLNKTNTNAYLDTVRQNLKTNQIPTANESVIIIKVIDMKKKGLVNMPLSLTCKKIKKIYLASTNAEGEAMFLVPANRTYEIGIDNIENYKQLIVPEIPVKKIMGFAYLPTKVNEIVKNDTVIQSLPANQEATSARIYTHVNLKDLEGNYLTNEDICLDVFGSAKVYKATTDAFGNAAFLIPKGKKYTINFKYEREVNKFDYTNIDKEQIRDVEIEFQYMGSAKIEEHYKTAKRNNDGFVTEFMTVPVKKITSFDKTKIKKTILGYNINFSETSDYIPSAAVMKNKFFVGGASSKEFYCFNTISPLFNWGLELAESGQSSVVCDSDVVLINTYSCTLYAIDANTGKLLWDKWLGSSLYSTPTLYKGKVYTVYPNDISNTLNDNYVLVCFDFRSGNIVWQKWIDKDVLASPVVVDNSVYLTSLSGKIYHFDAKDGKKLNETKEFAVCPPTVADGFLYVSVKNNIEPKKQELAIYDASTLNLLKNVPSVSSSLNTDNINSSYTERMNYNGARVVNYKGKNYQVTDGKLVCSSGKDGKAIWTTNLSLEPNEKNLANTSVSPVIAGNKIIVGNSDGNINLYDPQTGKILKQYNTNESLNGMLVVNNGWIYAGSEEGKLVTVNTKDNTLTDWNMWGYNSSHNPVIK
ncbi:MAG: PQQ-binding-like beta-propeller repeat protein, partial [Bacteroidetes bacterium]|nr:PQQ-binding-like beta-propeller repeat protein [Bacteroidota bacterium]